MKSLLVSLLLFAFAQGVQAAPFDLNEWHSKKLYNALASFGLRVSVPASMQTREWAQPALCGKFVNGVTTYKCVVHDEFRNLNVERTGAAAKKLYNILYSYYGATCEGGDCLSRAPDIKCIYWWPNKDNPPPRRYLCTLEGIPSLN
ncbi:MAG: hypothetical protein V4654_10790 [Bdellovibrionota bacterium]